MIRKKGKYNKMDEVRTAEQERGGEEVDRKGKYVSRGRMNRWRRRKGEIRGGGEQEEEKTAQKKKEEKMRREKEKGV